MKCKCGKEMENKGNVSGITYTSYHPQRDNLYVCNDCKTKKTERVYGYIEPMEDFSSYTYIE